MVLKPPVGFPAEHRDPSSGESTALTLAITVLKVSQAAAAKLSIADYETVFNIAVLWGKAPIFLPC